MNPVNDSWPEILEKILEGQDMTDYQSKYLMESWLEEKLSPVQTGAFLSALRAKKINGSELAAMANVLRAACPLPCSIPDLNLVDTCGTGGDGANTFNISTAVAFTASSCGAYVAKHGNRSASGKVGSADVLEALGLDLKAPLEKVVNSLGIAKITFLFAPSWHPALVNLAPLRKELGIRTIFNLLGPLVNPLQPSSQVLGVADSSLLDPMAEALQRLGVKKAIVVHGSGGLDEASMEGENNLRLIEGGVIKSMILNPSDLGLSKSLCSDIQGGDLQLNKEILTSVLQGKGSKAQRDIVGLNTALVLWSAGIYDDFKPALDSSLNSLNNGQPWLKLLELKNALKG